MLLFSLNQKKHDFWKNGAHFFQKRQKYAHLKSASKRIFFEGEHVRRHWKKYARIFVRACQNFRLRKMDIFTSAPQTFQFFCTRTRIYNDLKNFFQEKEETKMGHNSQPEIFDAMRAK